MEERMIPFTKNLTFLMERNGYTQASLGEKVGASRQAIGKWQRGESYPTKKKMDRLCEIFHVTQVQMYEELLSEESLKRSAQEQRLLEYFSRLNSEGLSKVLAYLDDLKAEYFRSDDHE